MHPAASVILFTTTTGFGYGLLIWLSLSLNLSEATAFTPSQLLIIIGTALSLITFGLLASLCHLGHPKRAWRAMSQWRTSWLSREGVFAVLVYPPTLLMGYFAYFWAELIVALVSIIVAILSLITVYCTAMIYASLKTIPAWHNTWTILGYLLHALSTGGILFYFIIIALFELKMPFFATTEPLYCLLLVSLAISLLNKTLYFRHIKNSDQTYTKEMATGLRGKITPLDPPHSSANYLMKEMGFTIARQQARILRPISLIATYIIPFLLLLMHFLQVGSLMTTSISVTALLSCVTGIASERYLFFAEAKHVITLYYR